MSLVRAAAILAASSFPAVAYADEPPRWFSLPFALRAPIAVDCVHADAGIATEPATTIATMVGGSVKLAPDVAVLARVPWTHVSSDALSGSAFGNPLVGALWTPEIAPGTRFGGFVGATAPVGQGGGDSPDQTARAVNKAAIYARSAMDNGYYAVDFTSIAVGADLAWSAGDVSVQGEATIAQLFRVRGTEPEDTRTNLTTGLNAGWRVLGPLAIEGEARYQRWLSTPAAVAAAPPTRDQMTVAAGARVDVALGGGVRMRPGVGYVIAVDDPMAAAKERVVAVHVPFLF